MVPKSTGGSESVRAPMLVPFDTFTSAGPTSTMSNNAIGRGVASLRRAVGKVRETWRRIGARRELNREVARSEAARARFWEDLREGQREADGHASRRNS